MHWRIYVLIFVRDGHIMAPGIEVTHGRGSEPRPILVALDYNQIICIEPPKAVPQPVLNVTNLRTGCAMRMHTFAERAKELEARTDDICGNW